MGVIKDQSGEVYRDSVTAGVPASGPNEPVKSEIRALFATVELQVSAAAAAVSGDGIEAIVAAIEPIRDDANDAADRAEAALASFGQSLLPTEVINGQFDPSLPTPTWAFGGSGGAPIVAADSAFQAVGLARAARIPTGGAIYLEVFPARQPAPGDWLAVSIHVAVSSAANWSSMVGRIVAKLMPEGSTYGAGFTDLNLLDFEEIDATHRRYYTIVQQPLSVVVPRVTLMVNLNGLSFGADVAAMAYASAVERPGGVDWSRNDPLGVQALKVGGLAPSVDIRGDSLTDGTGSSGASSTLASRIAYYLGGEASWLGVPGSMSNGIVAREVGVPIRLASDRLDSSGTTVVTEFYGRAIVGASNTDAIGSYPRWSFQPLTSPATGRAITRRFVIAGVNCLMTRTATPSGDGTPSTSESYVLTHRLLPTNVFVSATNTVATAVAPDADLCGLWAGTNDRYVPDDAIANILRWYQAGSGGKRFIITPLGDAGEPIGSTLGERVRQIAATLSATCGPYVVDALGSLLSQGLVSQGLTPTSEDFGNIAAGIIPLRLRSDAVHLNNLGYDALAQVIVCRMVEWSWVAQERLANVPLLLTA